MQPEQKVNILLVDDRPDNLLALEAVLDNPDWNLIQARSGQEALQHHQNHDFAAILLDVQMPGMDGFETARLIRQREKTQHTPIIFVTALGVTETHVSKGYSLGAVDYIIKPFEPDALRAKVTALVEMFKRTKGLEEQLREVMPVEQKVNILLVDDTPENLLAMEAALEDLGENIVKARSGEEALRHLLNNNFTVILLDIHMPDMSGFEVAELIKQSERFRHIPVVFITAIYKASEDVARGYALGAMDYIFTPINPEILRAKVRALVNFFKNTRALEQQLSLIQRLNVDLARSEAMLRDLNETLERRVAERTMDLQQQLSRISLLNQIARAIAERHDLDSIFRAVIARLEEHLPIDFGCVGLFDPQANTLTLTAHTQETHFLQENGFLEVEKTGLQACLKGEMVYMPDTAEVDAVCPQKLAQAGIHSLVAMPLTVSGEIFGVLIAARRKKEGFSNTEIEFLQNLSEHVSLAANHARLYQGLQSAYDALRQTQQVAIQQERLRALGQITSGIAHDINNALTPISGFAELLFFEPNLSDQAKRYLGIIRTASGDIGRTLARMREFYRQRGEQEELSSTNLNQLARQVIDLTRPRWKDIPQEHGVVVEIQTDLQDDLPAVMGVENEIREALTNLIFNSVDAMPNGGAITIRTYKVEREQARAPALPYVAIEVIDTGVGMNEETRMRCLEPFYSTKGEQGTGLGLAMVYGIMQRHEGEIEIESELGKGTTMRLIFPTKSVEMGVSVAEAVMPPPSRILCIDDETMGLGLNQHG